MELKYLLINSNTKEENGTNWGYLNLKNATEVKTKTSIEQRLVIDVITPLDTAFITL